jgi:tellurite resistance protein
MSNALRVPAAFFGIGLVGLGSCWRVAHRMWGEPSTINEGIMVIAGVVWGLVGSLRTQVDMGPP